MDRSQQSWNRRPIMWSVLAATVLTGALSWAFWPAKVELSPDAYEIAIALYRVCNQQDQQGLQQVQSKLHQLSQTTDADEPSIERLQRIVAEAQAGEWRSAMRHTHETLEDQTF